MWKGSGSVPDELIEEMAEAGMAGLEVDHPDHDDAQRAQYRAMAERLGLVPTGASRLPRRALRLPARVGHVAAGGRGRAPSQSGPVGSDQVPGSIDFVFLDIGGVLYDDRVYAEALRLALREIGAVFDDADYDTEYAAARAAQNGSFRRRLATRFVGPTSTSTSSSGSRRSTGSTRPAGSTRTPSRASSRCGKRGTGSA